MTRSRFICSSIIFLLTNYSIAQNISDQSIEKNPSNPNPQPEVLHPVPEDRGTAIIPLTPDCIKKVTTNYGVHPDILFAILLVERGTVGETNKGNSNGTKDLNLFQINEVNLPELTQYGITREDVLNDGCLAAAIATRHLLKAISGQPVPTNESEYLRLVARYHSVTPEKNAIYADKLKQAFEFLYTSKM